MKFKKPKPLRKLSKLTKREALPTKPADWKPPLDDKRSPLRISFRDDDQDRGDWSFCRVCGTEHDDVILPALFESGVVSILQGNMSEQDCEMVRRNVLRTGTEGVDDVSDENLRQEAQHFLEQKLGVTLLSAAPPAPDGEVDTPVYSMPLTYMGSLRLLSWLERNVDKAWCTLDDEADWFISGYGLHAAGVIDHGCHLNAQALEPNAEQRKRFAAAFEAKTPAEAERCARTEVIFLYLSLLISHIKEPEKNMPETFLPLVKHHRDYTEKWMVSVMAKNQGLSEGKFSVALVDHDGEVHTVLGSEYVAEHMIEMGPEYVQAMSERRVQQAPEGVQ